MAAQFDRGAIAIYFGSHQAGWARQGVTERLVAVEAKPYRIAAGTVVSIARDDSHREYRKHVVSRDLSFDRYRTKVGNAITFERDGWILLTRLDRLQKA